MDERGVGHGESIVGTARDVALTFDDGPGEVTPALLDVLAEHGAHATFFVLGRAVERRPDVLRRIAAMGHELGNHTFSHPHPGRCSDDELRRELERTGEAVAKAIGESPRLARPPYGEDAGRFARIAAALGLETVLWTIDPEDWREPTAEAIVERVLAGLHPGGIVDLHDGFAGGPEHPTVQGVAALLPELERRGYRCATVSGLRRLPA